MRVEVLRRAAQQRPGLGAQRPLPPAQGVVAGGLGPRRFRGRRAALSGAYVQPGLELETGEKGRRCGQIVGAERFVGAFEQPCVERAADDRDDIPPFRGGYVRFGDGSGRQRFAFRKGEPERLKGV